MRIAKKSNDNLVCSVNRVLLWLPLVMTCYCSRLQWLSFFPAILFRRYYTFKSNTPPFLSTMLTESPIKHLIHFHPYLSRFQIPLKIFLILLIINLNILNMLPFHDNFYSYIKILTHFQTRLGSIHSD